MADSMCPYSAFILGTTVFCEGDPGHKAFHKAHIRGAILVKDGQAGVRHDEVLVVWSDRRDTATSGEEPTPVGVHIGPVTAVGDVEADQ